VVGRAIAAARLAATARERPVVARVDARGA